MRAHAGPYSSVREFLDWVQRLAHTGLLDILSIGTSQLTQGNFGEDWADLPNGGGVPINSAAEYEQIWANSRPLLLRTYAGTKKTCPNWRPFMKKQSTSAGMPCPFGGLTGWTAGGRTAFWKT